MFERKVLRCIFGAEQENEIWQKRYNYELYEIINDSNIVSYIKVKRLAWAGHLLSMNDNRAPKSKRIISILRQKHRIMYMS